MSIVYHGRKNLKHDIKAVRPCYRGVLAKVVPLYNRVVADCGGSSLIPHEDTIDVSHGRAFIILHEESP